MGEFAPAHLIILLLVVALAFGSKRLPEIARGVGHGMREFKDGLTGASVEEPPAVPAPTVDHDGPASTPASASAVDPSGTNSNPTGPA